MKQLTSVPTRSHTKRSSVQAVTTPSFLKTALSDEKRYWQTVTRAHLLCLTASKPTEKLPKGTSLEK